MKSGWQMKRIGEVCELMTGGTPARSNPKFFGGDIKWLVSGDIHTGEIYDCEGRITEAGMKNSNAKLLPVNSVLIALNGQGKTRGTVAMLRTPATCNQSIVSIYPKLSAGLLPEFLYANLRGRYEELRHMTSDDDKDRRGLNMGLIRNIEIPIAPLEEQKKIVEMLQRSMESIQMVEANTRRNLENARTIFESYLGTVFAKRGDNWKEATFSELCEIKHGFAFKSKFFSSSGDHVLLTPGNFYEEGGYRDRGDKQKYYMGSVQTEYILAKGDLLVAMTEQAAGLLGSPILVPESNKFLHNQRLGLVVKKPGVAWSNDFFFHVFNTKHVRRAIQASSSGVKVRHTSPKKIGEVVIAFPASISEQKKIASALNKLHKEVESLESIYQEKLSALASLRAILLQKPFSIDTTQSPIVSPYQITIPGISTTDLHAGILALSYAMHENAGRLRTFGRVKGEKISHMVEAHVGIELGRQPVKDPAGPDDYNHLKKVEHRASKAGYFDFKPQGSGYQLVKRRKFDQLVESTIAALGEKKQEVERLIEIMVPWDTQQCEIFATTYAAWNNLLLEGKRPSDEDIVLEARENWHGKKMVIPRERFFAAIEWMKKNNMVPAGKGKRVLNKK